MIQPGGLSIIIKRGWERYEFPMAITEAQLKCGTREEQLRWLKEVWDIMCRNLMKKV